MKYFRIFKSKLPIGCMYDADPISGEHKTRNGTLYEIEFWLYKISFTFVFTIWNRME